MRPLVPVLLLVLAAAPAFAQSQPPRVEDPQPASPTPVLPDEGQGVADPSIPDWARQAFPDGVDKPLPRMAMPQAPRIATQDAQGLLEAGEIVFLDVREPIELEQLGTLKGYVNIPLSQLEKRMAELPQTKAIVTACSTGGRAVRAATMLESRGYAVIAFCVMADYKGRDKVYPKAAGPGTGR
jgi:rhodanese-related sulfurtransferase